MRISSFNHLDKQLKTLHFKLLEDLKRCKKGLGWKKVSKIDFGRIKKIYQYLYFFHLKL